MREKAMRSDEGRPNAGMRPRILLENGTEVSCSEVVEILEQHRGCVLEFNFQQQSFKIPFSVSASQKKEPVYEFTYWHNFLFNPHLPPEVKVLQFEPDWSGSSADPAPI